MLLGADAHATLKYTGSFPAAWAILGIKVTVANLDREAQRSNAIVTAPSRIEIALVGYC